MKEIEISAKETAELWKKGAVKLLDVRTEEERRIATIKDVPIVDMALAQEMVKSWPKDTPIIFHCHHGMRSLDAVAYFMREGFTNVKSMTGGIDAWTSEVDHSIPRY